MSLTAVRPYFRARLDSLGFNEWSDGFAFDNIPLNILDKSYHIETRTSSGDPINQQGAQTIRLDVTIRIMRKGFLNTSQLQDDVILDAENIIKECCKTSNRLTQTFKNIIFNGISIDPINSQDDNGAILTVNFTALVMIAV